MTFIPSVNTDVPEPTEAVTPSLAPVTQLPDPANFTWNLVTDGFRRPVNLAIAADGSNRLFVIEQAGLIRVLQDGVIQPTPFLDITDRVGSQRNEQGLLGVAFHPKFTENGYLYVNYTDRQGNTVIARFTAPGNATPENQTADKDSEKILLQVNQPYANHNGGHLLFGPDGMLWIGLGDGGSGGDPHNNAQSTQTYLGKLLRIDVDNGDPYAIPADNPFASGGGLPEIWALGLRNPWGITFDPLNGDLYLADVGQGQWEEINYLPNGFAALPVNFGWRIYEGNHLFSPDDAASPYPLTAPVFEYNHDLGCSVTGGIIYRGSELPEFYGVYLFADFCSGTIWGMLPQGTGSWQAQPLFTTTLQIVSLGVDETGEVFLLDLGGGMYRLERAK